MRLPLFDRDRLSTHRAHLVLHPPLVRRQAEARARAGVESLLRLDLEMLVEVVLLQVYVVLYSNTAFVTQDATRCRRQETAAVALPAPRNPRYTSALRARSGKVLEVRVQLGPGGRLAAAARCSLQRLES